MDASAYAFTHGVRHTRETLREWQTRPGRVLGRWFAGSALAAAGLLTAVLIIASLGNGHEQIVVLRPPFAVGDLNDVGAVLERNFLVLALHAMACVAGFIAGSSLPLQVEGRTGVSRWVHEHGTLLLGVLPHAIPELIALFLPLAAWIIASRRGEWEQLLAATFVTLAVAVPILVVAAFIEVYVSPHLFATLTHIHPPIVRSSDGFVVTIH